MFKSRFSSYNKHFSQNLLSEKAKTFSVLQNTTSLSPNELQKLSAISTPYQELKVPISPLVLSNTLGAKSKREQAELVSQGLLQPQQKATLSNFSQQCGQQPNSLLSNQFLPLYKVTVVRIVPVVMGVYSRPLGLLC